MDIKFKPLLASPAPRIIKFPVLVSEKLDGIRVCILNGKAVTRTLKEVPNRWIFKQLSNTLFDGLDGEVTVDDPTAPDVFAVTTSAVMSRDGNPDFSFRVFDSFDGSQDPYLLRLAKLYRRLSECEFPFIQIVKQTIVDNQSQLDELEEFYVSEGYEGVMIRDGNAPYKYGRSTAKEGILLKVKRFADAEGVVIRVEEKMTNQNPKTTNALGYSARSTAKSGMQPIGVMGALVVAFGNGLELSIGSGFTDDQRREIWEKRIDTLGTLCRYKYQPSGVKNLPRFPVFAGFRHPQDMGGAK